MTAMSERPSEKRRVLHVGCGRSRVREKHPHFEPAQWDEVRVDLEPAVQPDIVADMTDMSAVPPASFDAVFSSHNLEHLYAHQVPRALAEFRRVLRTDGFAMITVPDLELVARRIVSHGLDSNPLSSPSGPVAPLDMLYGYRPSLAAGILTMAHKTGFTRDTLRDALVAAGFGAVATLSHPASFSAWALAYVSPMSAGELMRRRDGMFTGRKIEVPAH
jgi:SAM-dependent methyltransferase